MKNKRTTIAGWLLIAGALATAFAQAMAGETPNVAAVLTALTGMGFLASADGGL